MINARTSKSGRIYSPGVLLGNWFEDVCLEEEQLSISKDGYIHFGDTVLFVNLDVIRLPEEKAIIMGGNLSLAVNPDLATLYIGDNLSAPCDLSAIEHVNPIGRNAFRILRWDSLAKRFGSKVGKRTKLASKGKPWGNLLDSGKILALEQLVDFRTKCDHKSFQNMAKKSSLQPVFMTDELSYLCAWQITFLDPQLRMEYEGLPIPANTKVVIVHSHTNQALAVPRTFWIRARRDLGAPKPALERLLWSFCLGFLSVCCFAFSRTYFGKECEINCHTYLDSHKAEESKNHWIIVTGNPSDESTTMFNRPKPPSEETRVQNRELHEKCSE
ncbi:hypothetical protein L345_07497 [Ophiophagus hannah]|uniref:Uncharacterized protein n=1 Tax=Ophiophagus hannah TaxID=8665 RepID=V8NXD1_OPHHA|nr:hypothetical protein L345_07497 [Ophiophagus hannah]